jgi:hypothetical protein
VLAVTRVPEVRFGANAFPPGTPGTLGTLSLICPREPRQVVAREAIDGPVGHRSRTEAAVEADSKFVPVQHGPLHAAAIARHRNAGEVTEQGTSNAATAPFRQNEKILEIQPGAAQKGGLPVVPDGKTGWLTVDASDHRFRAWIGPEQRLANLRLGRNHLARQLLVLGQRFDHPENQRYVGRRRLLDANVVTHCLCLVTCDL